jgi:hypothetical protein
LIGDTVYFSLHPLPGSANVSGSQDYSWFTRQCQTSDAGSFSALSFTCPVLQAQATFFSGWFDRSDQAKADQLHRMTPLLTVTPRLEQEFRTDLLIEQVATGHDLANYDGGKGPERIPNERVELPCNLPPYLEHNNPKFPDGSGEVSFVGKYRHLSR